MKVQSAEPHMIEAFIWLRRWLNRQGLDQGGVSLPNGSGIYLGRVQWGASETLKEAGDETGRSDAVG